MGEGQTGRMGQVAQMVGAIVTHLRLFEGWTSEERQTVIRNPARAIDLFREVVRSQSGEGPKEKRVAALKYLIGHSKDCNTLTKQMVFHLIDQSRLLTHAVYVSFESGGEYLKEELEGLFRGVHDMCSSNGTTHLSQIMHAMGTDFGLSFHGGRYDHTGIFVTRGTSAYTYWLAPGNYGMSRGGQQVELEELYPTRAELEAIDIKKDGLYDH